MSQPVPQGKAPAQGSTLALYDPKKFNVLLPTQALEQQVGGWHKFVVSLVTVDAVPGANNGDIYPIDDKGGSSGGDDDDPGANAKAFGLAKPALFRISSAGGVIWSPAHSGAIVDTPTRVVYRAVGAIRLPDGTWMPIDDEKDIDLTVVADELREKAIKNLSYGLYASTGADRAYPGGKWEKKTYKGQESNRYFLPESQIARYVEDTVRRQMIQWRKNFRMRAATGAYERAIRKGFALKSKYSLAELANPFAVPRVDFSPDLSDSQVRQFFLQHGTRDVSALFGGQAGQAMRQISGVTDATAPQALPASAAAADGIPMGEPGTQSAPFTPPAGAVDMQPPAAGPTAQQGPSSGNDDKMPWETGDDASSTAGNSLCTDCGKPIEDVTHRGVTYDAMSIAEQTIKAFGAQMCWSCAAKRNKVAATGGGQ